MKSNVDKAKYLFYNNLNCNQSVFAALCSQYGMDESIAIRVGMVYGGGMAGTGKTCGAVTGAYSVIGLWASSQSSELQIQKAISRAKAREFNELYQNQFGSIECRDLLGFNMNESNELEKIKQLGLFDSKCPILVGGAVEILENILK